MNADQESMDRDDRAGLCRERAGFLFKHPCDQIAVNKCAGCAKEICAAHTHETERGAL